MPELPEVETSVQAIQEFANQSLESIEIYNPNLRWKVETASFKKLHGLKLTKLIGGQNISFCILNSHKYLFT